MAEKLTVDFARVGRGIKVVARTIHDEAELRKKAQAAAAGEWRNNSCQFLHVLVN
jgi:hypothetical protein